MQNALAINITRKMHPAFFCMKNKVYASTQSSFLLHTKLLNLYFWAS